MRSEFQLLKFSLAFSVRSISFMGDYQCADSSLHLHNISILQEMSRVFRSWRGKHGVRKTAGIAGLAWPRKHGVC